MTSNKNIKKFSIKGGENYVKNMMFECPLCGKIIERDLILTCEKENFNKKNKSYKSYCDIYKRQVICREYENKQQ